MVGRWLSFAAVAVIVATVRCGDGGTMKTGEENVLIGPKFWTGDPAHPWADALLVSEGKITQLLDRVDVAKVIADGGLIRQLPGKLAVPGLTDSHGHFLGYAQSRYRVNLRGAASVEEALGRVEGFAKEHPEAPWILGRGWAQSRWAGKAWPDADRLERVTAGRPCALWRVDGHAVWVNRTALAAAGIGRETPDPPGGEILRDASGRPTGILLDEAMEAVRRLIPGPNPQQMKHMLAETAQDFLAFGLTGFHEMGVERPQWNAMQALASEGQFPLRVTAYVAPESEFRGDVMKSGPQTAGRLRLVGVKLFADGALGSRGARLFAPYRDEPKSRGLWVTEPEALARAVDEIMERGLQPAIHAIGDEGNHAAIAAIEAAERRNAGFRDLRPRIEHAQVLDPPDIPRFAAYSIVASMQPTHATSDMGADRGSARQGAIGRRLRVARPARRGRAPRVRL